jgi:capsule polysaccharide export protein KpsE/RkpR
MKTTILLAVLLLASSQFVPARADAQPTAFEKALYDKARYQVLEKLGDDDFVSYCVTMGVGGDTLLKLHDEIMAKQTELANLLSEGMTNDNPQIMAVNAALKDLRAQFAVKILEARKGLEVEARIADETLSSLSQYQK